MSSLYSLRRIPYLAPSGMAPGSCFMGGLVFLWGNPGGKLPICLEAVGLPTFLMRSERENECLWKEEIPELEGVSKFSAGFSLCL